MTSVIIDRTLVTVAPTAIMTVFHGLGLSSVSNCYSGSSLPLATAFVEDMSFNENIIFGDLSIHVLGLTSIRRPTYHFRPHGKSFQYFVPCMMDFRVVVAAITCLPACLTCQIMHHAGCLARLLRTSTGLSSISEVEPKASVEKRKIWCLRIRFLRLENICHKMQTDSTNVSLTINVLCNLTLSTTSPQRLQASANSPNHLLLFDGLKSQFSCCPRSKPQGR